MPILTDFTLPGSRDDLLRTNADADFFIAFITPSDPKTKQPWCPDVRAALPLIKATFSAAGAPAAALVGVGQRPEWKDPNNVYRTKWNVRSVPTVVRYRQVDGEIREVSRLEEAEILDAKQFEDLISKP